MPKVSHQPSRLAASLKQSVPISTPRLDWDHLLSVERIPLLHKKNSTDLEIVDYRMPHERDFDRVAFCTPVRRMKDKTQVFPLEMHDGVRTRLTHSMEVSNLARSMGIAICEKCNNVGKIKNAGRSVPALLSAIALVHDLGNPPFGHQGELAIRSWVNKNKGNIKKEGKNNFNSKLLKDFQLFEGNAQGFRVLARLQHQDHKTGLRLTASTLRAFMKYPWGSDSAKVQIRKPKFGVFNSEMDVFEWTCKATGLKPEKRHPLSYVMEVCDDIAYSVLDVEDAVKKELISAADLISFLSTRKIGSERILGLLKQYECDEAWLAAVRMPRLGAGGETMLISSKEFRDALIELFRSYAIGVLVSDAIDKFLTLESGNCFSTLSKGIAEDFYSNGVIKALKDFAALRVYSHPDVLKAELQGHRVIPQLMTAMWNAVVNDYHGKQSKCDEYVMSIMSPNYIRVYRQSTDLNLPLWYRQLQLVCDQVCGMSDSYALRIFRELETLGCI